MGTGTEFLVVYSCGDILETLQAGCTKYSRHLLNILGCSGVHSHQMLAVYWETTPHRYIRIGSRSYVVPMFLLAILLRLLGMSLGSIDWDFN